MNNYNKRKEAAHNLLHSVCQFIHPCLHKLQCFSSSMMPFSKPFTLQFAPLRNIADCEDINELTNIYCGEDDVLLPFFYCR